MRREVEPPMAWDQCDPRTRQAANSIDLALQSALPALSAAERTAVVDLMFAGLEDDGLVLRLVEISDDQHETHFDWCRRTCALCGHRASGPFCPLCGFELDHRGRPWHERTPE